ncbi:Panacea domain-containing protein [Candidatus Palauibacter sp.]|uniref:Panacea domain-containing protein n=1 Tax=Candidatus Palauibacter sp. TaxID=3101350 RepID=UPI003B0246D6
MYPRFKQAKTTQLACEFLRLAGGRMSYMKLIKLLYLVDRRSLLERGVPVTYDRYVSMSHGPVLSETLDLINYGSGPSEESYWETHVDQDSRYEVSLKGDCPLDELSDAEVDLARAVYAEFGKMDRWAVVERLHQLPEWRDPGEVRVLPIRYEDILAHEKTPDESEQIIDDLRAMGAAEAIFG